MYVVLKKLFLLLTYILFAFHNLIELLAKIEQVKHGRREWREQFKMINHS